MKTRGKNFILVLLLILVAFKLSSAQEAGTSTYGLSREEQIEYRNRILDLWGLPHDTPLTIFDIMKGNPFGVSGTILTPQLHLIVGSKNLRPGSDVDLRLEGSNINLQAANIEWYRNGKKVSSGLSESNIKIKLGPIGSAETIRVVARDAKALAQATRVIYPARIHFSWFTDGYTPVWYRGKSLALPASVVNIVAIPDVRIGKTKLSSSDLIYEWDVDGVPMRNFFGQGKNVYPLRLSESRGVSYRIGLTLKDTRGRVEHKETIEVEAREGIGIFYEIDPLYGEKTWKAPESMNLASGNGLLIKLEPFYFPKSELAQAQYRWTVNGENVGSLDSNGQTIRLDTEAGSYGSQFIAVQLKKIGGIFRQLEAKAMVNIISQ